MEDVNAVYVGPWGGDPQREGEYEVGFWEVYGDIHKITVKYGDVVDSLIIEYSKGGYKKKSVRFGGEGGKETGDITLGNGEYLVTIGVSVDKDPVTSSLTFVTSLTFFTNLRPTGIILGTKKGAEFSLPMKAGKIVGLFGFVATDEKNLKHLKCIGVSLVPPFNPPNQADNAVDVGPLGVQPKDEDKYGFWEVHGDDIQNITVKHGDLVHSLIITYIKGGIKKKSVRFGGEGVEGENTDEIPLPDGEHPVTIEGTLKNGVVSSLTFITNQGRHGPFGKESGEEFSLPVKVGKIAGLFGFAGQYLNAIGVGLVPSNQGTVELGPWGGDEGTPWVYDEEIRSFQVAYDGLGIVSITFNGSKKFGGSGGKPSETVYLKSGEYLLSIEGAAGEPGGDNSFLQAISFVSSVGTHGPYGTPGNGAVSFNAPVKNGKIVGFTGRHGKRIYAIGFKVAQVPE